MKDEVRIRRAHLNDAAAILELEKLFPGDRMSSRSVHHFLRTPSAHVWVGVAGAKITSSLIMLTRHGSRIARIYSVVVSPGLRGRGVGAQLVRAAETAARRHGCSTMSLEVREDNKAARALYAKLGYAEHARLQSYYDDGAAGLRLRKTL